MPLTLDDRKSGMAVGFDEWIMPRRVVQPPTAADRPHYHAGDFIFCGLTHLFVRPYLCFCFIFVFTI